MVHTCPRRMRELGPWDHAPSLDRWSERTTPGVRHCSFCGSVHPDDFMAKVAAGEMVIPTDKNYKAYLGTAHLKFYYMHLSEAQMLAFIELYNSKVMQIGVPGYFYRPPFFMSFTDRPRAEEKTK